MAVYSGDELADRNTTGNCSFCGNKADAFWHGRQVVEVCLRCAREDLPRLMADACVQYQPGRFDLVEGFWRDAKAVFFQAVAFSAFRKAQPKPPSQEE